MQHLHELLEPFKTVTLGTISNNGYPFSSYAPFYYDEEVVYIFISNIATHAQNIQARPKASAFFIEDESITDNMFRRKRISLQCDVSMIPREHPTFETIMQAFIEKQGSTLNMLMGMADFNLYALTPMYGEATFGFGEAYNIGGDKMNQLIPRGSTNSHENAKK
ncbi:MAG: Heme iron utilization protein [uncultured Sulfurovum sp.]|uniref:Heme iron utilization protein n=1 Tax=uncultured Sulfurovum sp. TaxID=269237 RepID=A0A6S6SJU9_9BACT|nr:MAG: Heme iron utilization protein [uncultured Sulfurovum sp.]